MKKKKKTDFNLRNEIRRNLCAILASIIFAINIKTFVNAGGLFPGGFTGITLLIQKSAAEFLSIALPYSAINYLLNLFPVILGFKKIGVKFTTSSCLTILLTGFLADIIPACPITYDVLLISIFGGLINGLAVAVCLLGGTSSGGTDFIAIYAAERFRIDPWFYVLGFNALILIIAGALFGWDAALYSIIFQFTSTQVVNMLHRQYKRVTVLIITQKPQEVYESIQVLSHHSATKFAGTGCYQGENKYLIYSVVASSEVKHIVNGIKGVDDKAFVNVLKTEQLYGNFYQNIDY